MSWEVFEPENRNVVIKNKPSVSINVKGRIILNTLLCEAIPNFPFCQVLIDDDEKKLGIKFFNEMPAKSDGVINITDNSRKRGRLITAGGLGLRLKLKDRSMMKISGDAVFYDESKRMVIVDLKQAMVSKSTFKIKVA